MNIKHPYSKPRKLSVETIIIRDNPDAFKKLKISLGMIVAVFAFLLYTQSIFYNYTQDDASITRSNKLVNKGFYGIPTLLKTDYWYGYNEQLRGPIYRPIPLILLAIEWQFFPDLPHIYHLVNVFLFAFTCWLMFILLCKLFNNQNLLFPFICSLLYSAHPIHTEVIDSIKSIDEILCFFFAILSIIHFIKYLEKNSILNLIVAAACFFFSLLSKETGITFLLVIPVLLYVSTTINIKRTVTISILLAATTASYILIRYLVLNSIPLNHNTILLLNNSLYGAPNIISEKATAFYILGRYIMLLIFPHRLSYDYSFNQIPIQTLSSFSVLVSIISYFAIGIYAAIKIRSKSILAFAILFYLITLAPVSNIFMLIGATMAERFMYIPSFGFCIALAYLLIKFTKADQGMEAATNLKQMVSSNPSLILIVFVIISLYSFKTITRNPVWKDNLSLFGHDVEVADNSTKAHSNLGVEYLLNLYPEVRDSAIQNNYLDKAIVEFNKAINIDNNIREDYIFLARAYLLKKEYAEAIKVYKVLLQFDNKSDTSIQNNLATAYYDLGLSCNNSNQFEKAIPNFDSAIKYNPNFSSSYNNKSVALLELGNYNDAIIECEKAIAIDSLNHNAYTNIGCAYTNLNQFVKALDYLKKAASIDTTDYYPVYIMGVTYKIMGDEIKSKQYFEQATILQNKR